jgi:hypothetical protein
MRRVGRVVTMILLTAAAGCATDEEPGPAPLVAVIEPEAICPSNVNAPVFVGVWGGGFVVNEDHTVETVVELWRGGHADVGKFALLESDRDGGHLTLAFQNGESAPASNEPPVVFEARVVNPNGQFAIYEHSFSIHSSFGFGPISPTTAARGSQLTLNLSGSGFYDPMRVTIESQLPTFATNVQVTSPTTASASFDLTSVPAGTYAVSMRNGGGCKFTVVSAFTVTP